MSKHKSPVLLSLLLGTFMGGASLAQDLPPSPSHDWATWGYDQERSGWNRGETTLSPKNVGKLKLLWVAQLSTKPADVALSTLTAPLIVEGVNTAQGPKNMAYLLGADDTLFAIDVDNGAILWQKAFPDTITPVHPATWLCSNNAQATPVIDRQRGLIFLISSDGKLHGLDIADGADRMAPTTMVNPYVRDWSLNLIGNVVYTAYGRGCGQLPGQTAAPAASSGLPASASGGAGGVQRPALPPVVPGTVAAMDVGDLSHPVVTRFFTSDSRPAGPWGRGGVVKGPDDSVIVQTADGLYDPAGGMWGESVIKLAPKLTRVMDSFTPQNWQYMNSKDLDFGSASPSVFPFSGKTLIATAGKEGVLYILNANDLGGGPPGHATPVFKSPQLGNDAASGTQPGEGDWSSVTTYVNAQGMRYLYVPIWGPPSKSAPTFKYTYGAAPNGSVMAFHLTGDGAKLALDPVWMSPNLLVPDAPVVANGVVYAIQTGEQTLQAIPPPPGAPTRGQPGFQRTPPDTVATTKFRATPISNLILYAFDADTGKTLFSSKNTIPGWTHFSEPVVALGKVFVITHDAKVYAFGLKR